MKMPRGADYEVEHPMREAIEAITGKTPPDYIKGAGEELTDDQKQDFQGWCLDNAPRDWMTGLGVWEAAEVLVAGAVENGNIMEPESWERLRERARESSFELHRVEERVKYVLKLIEENPLSVKGLTDRITDALHGELDGELE